MEEPASPSPAAQHHTAAAEKKHVARVPTPAKAERLARSQRRNREPAVPVQRRMSPAAKRRKKQPHRASKGRKPWGNSRKIEQVPNGGKNNYPGSGDEPSNVEERGFEPRVTLKLSDFRPGRITPRFFRPPHLDRI